MDRPKFDEFRNYILKANRHNRCVIEIFQTSHTLKEEAITELIHLKPNISSYQYEAHIDSILLDLKKLQYPNDIDYSKINPWLEEFNTSKEEFLHWHTENPNASQWETKNSSNNMLYEILSTELEVMVNLEYPNQGKYPHLNNYSYSDIQFINNHFEKFIKTVIVSEFTKYIISLRNPKLNTENRNKMVRHKFHGSQTQFIELIKSLIVNKNLKGVQKEIIKDLATFFDIEINNPDKLIQDIKKRNNGSETLFLDKLKSSLIDYIKK